MCCSVVSHRCTEPYSELSTNIQYISDASGSVEEKKYSSPGPGCYLQLLKADLTNEDNFADRSNQQIYTKSRPYTKLVGALLD